MRQIYECEQTDRKTENRNIIPNSTPPESDQGNSRLLKVVDLRPESDGRGIGGPGVVLSQRVLGLPQLRIHHRQVHIQVSPPPTLSDLLRNALQLFLDLRQQLLVLQPQNRKPKDHSGRVIDVLDRIRQLWIVDAPPQRLRVVRDRSEVFQQFPFLGDDVRTPVGGVDHTKEDGESDLLDIIGVLDAVDGGSPIDAQAPHLIGFHDRMRGVEPPVTDEREEEESGLVKLERLVILKDVTDNTNERRLGGIKELQGINGDGT